MFRKRLGVLLIAAAVAVSFPANVQSQEQIREGSLSGALDSLSKSVESFCTSNKIIIDSANNKLKIEDIVLKVKEFEMPEKYETGNSTGKRLAKMFSDALSKRKVKVLQGSLTETKATHVVYGTCQVGDLKNGVELKLIVTLKTAENLEVIGFRESVKAVEVTDREEIARELGITADLTPVKVQSTGNNVKKEIAATIQSKLTDAVKNPTVAITASQGANAKQTIISPTTSSKFKIEVLVKNGSEFVPTPVAGVGGMAVVGLSPKDAYAVRIYNDFEFDVAVKLTLDGINSLSLSEVDAYRRLGCWIIPRKSNATVAGWHKNDNEVKEFLVTSYPESVSQMLGGTAEGIGVIQAQFFPAWNNNEQQPFEELAGLSRGDGGLSTGAGQVKPSQSQKLTRYIGQTLLGAVTVRYSRPEVPMDLPKDAPKK